MKEAYDEAMRNIEQLRSKMMYAEALELLPSLTDYPEKKIELEKKRLELDNLVKLKEKSLFA